MDASRITMNWQAHASARTIPADPVRTLVWLRVRVLMSRSLCRHAYHAGGEWVGSRVMLPLKRCGMFLRPGSTGVAVGIGEGVTTQQAAGDPGQPPSLVPGRFQRRGVWAV